MHHLLHFFAPCGYLRRGHARLPLIRSRGFLEALKNWELVELSHVAVRMAPLVMLKAHSEPLQLLEQLQQEKQMGQGAATWMVNTVVGRH